MKLDTLIAVTAVKQVDLPLKIII